MIQARIDRIAGLLARVKKYNEIVTVDSFQDAARGEMKDNVKAILDEVKDEIDQIKDEVDNW